MIVSASVTHNDCSLAALSLFSKTHKQEEEMMHAIIGQGVADEVIAIKTCNRYELYMHVRSDMEGMMEGMERIFGEEGKLMRYRTDEEAISHLFKVAATLDSMIIGEHQVLGQVKGALELAREQGTAGVVLTPIFERAIKAGKRVRSETDLCQGNISMASVAICLAENALGSLKGKNALILGAGKVSSMIAKILSTKGLDAFYVTNRKFEKALSLAESSGAKAIAYEIFKDHLPFVDIIFCASSAPHALLHRDELLNARDLRTEDIMIVDMAMPPDVEMGPEGIDGIEYHGLDDIMAFSRQIEEARRRYVPKAKEIISEEYNSLMRQEQVKERKMIAKDISIHAELIRESELEKLLSIHDPGPDAIEAFSKAVVKKTLHNLFANIQDAETPIEGAMAARDLIIRNPKNEEKKKV